MLSVSEKLNKLNLTTMVLGDKTAFVEIDTLGTMLENGWNISHPKLDEWDELVPLYLEKNRIWCFNTALDLFVRDGWLVDDASKRVYKKLKTKV